MGKMQKMKTALQEQGGTEKKQKQKYFNQSHLTKSQRKNPPTHGGKFDREILEGLAEKYQGSIVGRLASERLQAL